MYINNHRTFNRYVLPIMIQSKAIINTSASYVNITGNTAMQVSCLVL